MNEQIKNKIKTCNWKKWFRIGYLIVLFLILVSLFLWGDSSFLFLGLAIVLIGIMIIIYYNLLRNK